MSPRRVLAVAAGLSLSACATLIGADAFEIATDDVTTTLDDSGSIAADGRALGTDAEPRPSIDDAALREDAPAPKPPQRRPPEGTYTYAVDGHDKVSGIITLQTAYSAATVTIVHVGDRCFDQIVHLRMDYDETMRLCLRKEAELEQESFVHESSTRTQKFSIGSASTVQTCAPGDVYFNAQPPPEKTWLHDCTGRNSDNQSGSDSDFRTKGDYRFVGRETLSILGADVPVLHFHDTRTVTGSQTGTNAAEWYFSAVDGVLVRLKARNIAVKYGAFVNYTEVVTDMTLSALPDGGLR